MKTLLVIASLLGFVACGGAAMDAAPSLPLAGQWLVTDSQSFLHAHLRLTDRGDGSFGGGIGIRPADVPVGSLELCIGPTRDGACAIRLSVPDLEPVGSSGYRWSGQLEWPDGRVESFAAEKVSGATAHAVPQ